ncbi:MAG: DUF4349 domain-containing protein [Verrucomicrobiae bacterium]|nr:DUF4349 domain-containing protein [Verrucomicrobiae bacterium]
MKKTIRRALILLFGSFGILFLLRIVYGYVSYPLGGEPIEEVAGQYGGSFEYAKKNYASAKPKEGAFKGGSGSTVPLSVEQKYEKIGTITSKSGDYESDETRIREEVRVVGGLIQFEQNSGLPGKRSLHLAIGVVPVEFDGLIEKLKAVGTLVSIRIDKTDKTNEYKTLQARRTSLENTKKSLEALKSIGTGSIEELIDLEAKISETESEIQDLGVSLGDYDLENEFCTIKCSLLEVVAGTTGRIGIPQRLKVAFEWTVRIYSRLVFIGFFGTTALWAMFFLCSQIDRRFPNMIAGLKAAIRSMK